MRQKPKFFKYWQQNSIAFCYNNVPDFNVCVKMLYVKYTPPKLSHKTLLHLPHILVTTIIKGPII